MLSRLAVGYREKRQIRTLNSFDAEVGEEYS